MQNEAILAVKARPVKERPALHRGALSLVLQLIVAIWGLN